MSFNNNRSNTYTDAEETTDEDGGEAIATPTFCLEEDLAAAGINYGRNQSANANNRKQVHSNLRQCEQYVNDVDMDAESYYDDVAECQMESGPTCSSFSQGEIDLHDDERNIYDHEDTEESIRTGNPSISYVDHGRKGGYKCWFCPSVQYSMNDYLSHKEKHLLRSTFPCNYCSFSSGKLNGLQSHLKLHRNDARSVQNQSPGLSKASRQSISTTSSSQAKFAPLASTSMQNNNKRPKPFKKRYKCLDKNCPVVCYYPSDFERHKRRHTENGGHFRCSQCSYRADKLKWWTQHLEFHAKKSNTALVGVDTSRKNVSSTSISNLTGRAGVVSGLKCPFKNCPTTLSCRRDLNTHISLHDNPSKRLKCPLCSYGADLKGHMAKHLQIHERAGIPTGAVDVSFSPGQETTYSNGSAAPFDAFPTRPIRPLKCKEPLCPQTFCRQIDLTNHMMSHGAKKRYLCSKCDYSVESWKSFRLHQQEHIGAESGRSIANKLRAKARAVLGVRKLERGPIPENDNENEVAQPAMDDIKKGNPKFKYATHRMSASGRSIPISYRCLQCPKALASFHDWTCHQNTHKGTVSETVGSSYKQSRSATSNQFFINPSRVFNCRACNYSTKHRSNLFKHRKTLTHIDRMNATDKKPYPQPLENQITSEIQPSEVEMKYEIQSQMPEEESPSNLITSLEIRNFMLIADSKVVPRDNLCCLQGGQDTGKTTSIVAVLIGLGLDVMLDLQNSSTICGVEIGNVLRYGEASGYVELGLDIHSYQNLRCQYGNDIHLRRYIHQGIPLSECEIEISYGEVVRERISRAKLKCIIGHIFPTFCLKIMLLNAENLQHFAENFHFCNEIFWKVVEWNRNEVTTKSKLRKAQLHHFESDLRSRQLRISFLRSVVKHPTKTLSAVRQLQVCQMVELKEALENYSIVKDIYLHLKQEEASFNGHLADHTADDLVQKMRSPFKKYLDSQNYCGDIILAKDEQELIVWIKDGSSARNTEPTIDEAKQICKSLTIGRRKLVVIGLYIAFWKVMNCCPIMLSDCYSSSDLEFKVPNSALPVILGVIKEEQSRQFFLSLPDEIPQII